MSASERLKENIRKYRTEERLLAIGQFDNGDNEEQDEESVPQSPSTQTSSENKLAELSTTERLQKLECEVNSTEINRLK